MIGLARLTKVFLTSCCVVVYAWPSHSEPVGQKVVLDVSNIPHLYSPASDSLRRGSGDLGRALGLSADSPLTLGGEWFGNGSIQMSGGWIGPYRRQSAAQAAILDLRLNLEKAKIWQGGEIWVQGLQYNVSNNANNAGGSVQQFNNLISTPPFARTELYTYGLRQNIFGGQIQLSLGKLFPGYYFGAVARPIPESDPMAVGGPNTNLLFLPPYSQPTFIGREPGYPDSTLGGVITLQPDLLGRRTYLTLGVFDGRAGVGPKGSIATGLQAGGTLSGPLLTMAEAGTVWGLGNRKFPGQLAVGFWNQSGKLTTPCSVTPGSSDCPLENGTSGIYAYAIQTMASFKRQGLPGKMVGFLQGGTTPSSTNMMQSSISAGIELVAPFRRRPKDSYGLGFSWAKLNDNPNAEWGFNANELMLQVTGRFHVWENVYAQPVFTWLPQAGFRQAEDNGASFTLQLSTSF